MLKILGKRLYEVYKTTRNVHTKKIIEGVYNVAKMNGFGPDRAIPILEKSLSGQNDDVVQQYFSTNHNLLQLSSIGAKQAIQELKSYPIYHDNGDFANVVDYYDEVQKNKVHEYKFASDMVNQIKPFSFNKSVVKCISLMEERVKSALPYVMIANVIDSLEEYRNNKAYQTIFARLNTAMSLPANLAPMYVLKNLFEYSKSIPQIESLIRELHMMEKSWYSRTMPKITSTITRNGRYKMTGINSPTVSIKEGKVSMINKKYYLNDGKLVKEFKEKNKLPKNYLKLCESLISLNAMIDDDRQISALNNDHMFDIKFDVDGIPVIFIDNENYDMDSAMIQMDSINASNDLVEDILNILAYGNENIKDIDAVSIEDDNCEDDAIVFILSPTCLSICCESKLINNVSASKTRRMINESYGIDMAHLLKEGLEQEGKKAEEDGIENEKYKKEMVDIEVTINQIEDLDEESRSDKDISAYYQELLKRRDEIREKINGGIADTLTIDDGDHDYTKAAQKIAGGLEELRLDLLDKKKNGGKDTEIEGTPYNISDELSITPSLHLNINEQDIIDRVILKVTNRQGGTDGIPSLVNKQTKQLGFNVINGNSLQIPYDGTLDDKINEKLIDGITSTVEGLCNPDNNVASPDDNKYGTNDERDKMDDGKTVVKVKSEQQKQEDIASTRNNKLTQEQHDLAVHMYEVDGDDIMKIAAYFDMTEEEIEAELQTNKDGGDETDKDKMKQLSNEQLIRELKHMSYLKQTDDILDKFKLIKTILNERSQPILRRKKYDIDEWKASLLSRHKGIKFVRESKNLVARSGCRLLGRYRIVEEKSIDDGFINGYLTNSIDELPVETDVKINAQQYLKLTKDDMIEVYYGGKQYMARKADIAINLMESINEEKFKLNRFDNLILKKLFEEKLSIKQLANQINEGWFGELVGGLTGFALGNRIGELVAKTLGVGQGILYDLLTSRLFGAAIGSAIGENV